MGRGARIALGLLLGSFGLALAVFFAGLGLYQIADTGVGYQEYTMTLAFAVTPLAFVVGGILGAVVLGRRR